MGRVIDRPKIKEQFTQRYTEIVQMLEVEMTTCEDIFYKQIDLQQVNKNLYPDYNCPPVAAFIRWCNQLEARISTPVKDFQKLQHE